MSSASEKLKALAADIAEAHTYTTGWNEERPVIDALPQIVAVVEAAARAEAYLENSSYLVGAEGVLEELAPALAALREALGEPSV